MLCGDYMEDAEVFFRLYYVIYCLLIKNEIKMDLQVMVPFQALQAYGLLVDAVCPAKKSGDICPTAIHQTSPPPHQVINIISLDFTNLLNKLDNFPTISAPLLYPFLIQLYKTKT